MSWYRASESMAGERAGREEFRKRKMRFGITYLDDATGGILPTDLVLLGAPSGIGKTQLCCNIANANLMDGKKIRMFALESDEHEIERRIKYQLVAARFFADPLRKRFEARMNFRNWVLGEFGDALDEYERWADDYFASAYQDLWVYYKNEEFNIGSLVENVIRYGPGSDLIIVDHAHYFDFDDDNENRSLKQLVKTARSLALEERVPIVLVAHLRKRSKDINEELVADMEEFHGSSDLFKVATKVVTLAPGKRTEDGSFETFFRASKCRIDGGTKLYIGKTHFSPKKGEYEDGYKIAWSSCTRRRGFEEIDRTLYPDWAKQSPTPVQGSAPDASGQRLPLGIERRPYVD